MSTPDDSGPRQELSRLFQQAREGRGREYEEAETLFCARGEAALEYLRQAAPSREDPMDDLLIYVLERRLRGDGAVFDLALALPDNLEKLARSTPSPEPGAWEIAQRLARYYQSVPAPYLAFRLARQQRWPGWKARGILLYLQEQLEPTTLPALIRFHRTCGQPELRALARSAIEAFPADLVRPATEAESKIALDYADR